MERRTWEAQSHLLRSNELRFSSLPQDISPDLHVYNSTSLVTNRLLSQKSLSAQKPCGSFCLFWCIAIWFEWTSLNTLNRVNSPWYPDAYWWAHKLRLAAFDRSSSWTMAIQLFSEMTSAKVQPDRHPVAFMKVPEKFEMRREIPLCPGLKIHRADWPVTPHNLSEVIPTTASSAPVNNLVHSFQGLALHSLKQSQNTSSLPCGIWPFRVIWGKEALMKNEASSVQFKKTKVDRWMKNKPLVSPCRL